MPLKVWLVHNIIFTFTLLLFCRKILAFNLCIARRSGTASRAWHLLSINPLTGSCLAKFRRARVCILFDCLQSFLDGSRKASLLKLLMKNKQKKYIIFLFVSYLLYTLENKTHCAPCKYCTYISSSVKLLLSKS